LSEIVPPEIRIDQLTGLRTILAEGRADRPIQFTPTPRKEGAEESCPFCEGREQKTPLEVWADRPGGEADTPGWRVRAVPNLYPAVGVPAVQEGGAEPSPGVPSGDAALRDPLRASARVGEADLFARSGAGGAHEVIVSTPRHVVSLGELGDGALAAAVSGWRERMRAHSEASCVQLIVNEGGGAGASLEHSHAQLYALDFVPVQIARERERFTAYAERTMGGELLADIASEEVRRRERLVAIDEDAMVICPWASHGAFEVRVIPRRSAAHFEEDEVGAAALGTALRALRGRFGDELELNLWVRTAPRATEAFHWHIDIAPKLSHKAGFELSTGVDISIVSPERAAAELREALSEGG